MIVQWDNICFERFEEAKTKFSNETKHENILKKNFSFQVTLKKNGEILIIYKKIPLEFALSRPSIGIISNFNSKFTN